eukprot:5752478-Amphidinium_carterae.1
MKTLRRYGWSDATTDATTAPRTTCEVKSQRRDNLYLIPFQPGEMYLFRPMSRLLSSNDRPNQEKNNVLHAGFTLFDSS